jgi:hypothetical protein
MDIAQLSDVLQAVGQLLLSQPSSTWGAVLSLSGVAGAIAVILQVAKKTLIEKNYVLTIRFWPFKKKTTITTEGAVLLILAGMSLSTSALNYIVTHSNDPVLTELFQRWAEIVAIAVYLHRFTVSPGYAAVRRFLLDIKNGRNQRQTPTAAPDGPVTPTLER